MSILFAINRMKKIYKNHLELGLALSMSAPLPEYVAPSFSTMKPFKNFNGEAFRLIACWLSFHAFVVC